MRIRSCFIILLFSVCFKNGTAQQKMNNTTENKKPKLVIGLVIDQMRWDYLYRFSDLYGNDGFKRLLNEGFSYENTMVPYTPTYTAPGHTCIYTGSVPAIHGIIGNYWYDKRTGKSVYCTDDSTVSTVGNEGKAGKMSPKNMWTTTITDELRLSNNFKSRVFGIALKDRGAILPAGHSANAAYWFDTLGGKFISSTHYMNQLPAYVNEFNEKDLAGKYMTTTWETLLPINKYVQSTADDKTYEDPIPGLKTVTFPYDLSLITKGKYESFKYTPFAATFTFDFAKTIVDNEKLGANNVTDFLTISISSTDYAGHHFGPNSIEEEDTYLRLDKDIAAFLTYLDGKFGKGNYLVFLSADHAVAHVPGFLTEHNIPAGTFSNSDLRTKLNAMIESKYGIVSCVSSIQNYQVYINRNKIKEQGKNADDIISDVISSLKVEPFIIDAVETAKINAASITQPQRENMINGYNAQRSGDIQFMVKPGYFDALLKGTTHGAWNPYDAHIPLLFFGWHVKQGKTNRETYMTDIAPTIAAMLQVQMPSGNVGKVLEEMVR
ncbi:MAG: alkaline phosphatase family protein [Ferruginibacter sp.]